MDLLATARFHITVVRGNRLEAANPLGLPEVAFVGRSNAGKSTCLNLLCNRRRLAFSSRTPGRTQALNLFAVGPPDEPVGYLVDTPGYGYASAGKDAKQAWQKLAGEYVQGGPPLCAVVLMLDIRRGITALDEFLISWVPPALRLIVVLTKADKLPSGQRRDVLRQILADARLAHRPGPTQTILFSATARIGVDELKQAVANCFVEPGADVPSPADVPSLAVGPRAADALSRADAPSLAAGPHATDDDASSAAASALPAAARTEPPLP